MSVWQVQFMLWVTVSERLHVLLIKTHLQDVTTVELAIKQWCTTDKLTDICCSCSMFFYCYVVCFLLLFYLLFYCFVFICVFFCVYLCVCIFLFLWALLPEITHCLIDWLIDDDDEDEAFGKIGSWGPDLEYLCRKWLVEQKSKVLVTQLHYFVSDDLCRVIDIL